MDRAQFLLQIANFVRSVGQLRVEFDAFGCENLKHLADKVVQGTLSLNHLLHAKHRLPDVALVRLIALTILLHFLSIEQGKFVEMSVACLTLAHGHFLRQLLRGLHMAQEFLEHRSSIVSVLFEDLLDVQDEDFDLLLD